MILKKLIFIVFSVFFIEKTLAQNVQILDFETKQPIVSVAVFCNRNASLQLSDKNGNVNLESFAKSDSVNFKHASYIYKQLTYTVLQNKSIVYLHRKNIELVEFVVSASKYKENKKYIAYSIETIPLNLMNQIPPPSSADLLTQNGNVMIQKTQGGGGSPILRGFEANKLLLVVDGVRMNNAIYRSGHLQNSITIDNAILEKVEIVFGPSSVIYGSDALGGSIHYFTKKPKLSKNNQLFSKLNAYSRYSSADNAFHFHTDLNLGKKKIASLTSFTFKDFNNINIGKNRNENVSDNYGLTNYYAETENNKDSMFVNSNPEIQIGTAYKQYDFLQKILFAPSKRTEIIANIQYSTSSNIDRYDKLTEMDGDNLKYAEYYYAPQNRLFTSLSLKSKSSNKYFTNSTAIFSLQKIDEDRINRKFNNSERNIQKEDLWAYAANFDFVKILNQNRLNYGAEIVFNTLNSSAFYENTLSGEIADAQTRYPNGNNFTQNYSLYANYKHFLNTKTVANLGARYSLANLYSEFEGVFFDFLDFKTVDISASAPTGIASLVYNPNKNWKLTGITSTAYRIPNIDDYGKVRAKNNEVTIPAKDLKPEYSYNAEFGIEKRFFTKVKMNFTAYHTWLTNAITRTYSQINGLDSMLYDGDKYRIIINTNAQKAVIYGFSLALNAKFNLKSENNSIKELEIFSTLTYTKGRNITENLPLGHIPPLFGTSRIKYKYNKLHFTFWSNYNALKSIANFSPYGEDNEEQAPDFGYPAWFSLNTQFSYSFNERINLLFAIENILDKHYKSFASAISAPGRNVILSFKFQL